MSPKSYTNPNFSDHALPPVYGQYLGCLQYAGVSIQTRATCLKAYIIDFKQKK